MNVSIASVPERSAMGALLSAAERRALGIRLTLALMAGGLLVLSLGMRLLAPDQADVAELVAGGAALLVAFPAIAAAWQSLKYPDLHGLTDQLIALAMIAAWAAGDLVTAALLPLVMTVGHILEERSLLGSEEAIRALARLTQTKARRKLPNGTTEDVPAQSLRVGDMIELRAGDRIAADGLVRAGRSTIDTAPITGESVPAEVEPGSAVFNGSINLEGLLLVEIMRVGAETTLGRVVSLMQKAERAKPPVTRLLERYAGRYMVLVLLIAAGAWFATGSVTALLAVLVASCPCALVLAAPATSIAAIAVAARHGVLVKGVAFLEELATVNSVVLDKTGTVTLGELRLVETRPEPGIDAREMMRIAGTLGAASNHPVARALAALVPGEQRLIVTEVKETQGLGILAQVGDAIMALGRPELFRDLRIATSPPPAHDGPIAGVSCGSRFLGWMLFADEARAEARQAVAELKALGLERQVLLTGDRATVAERVAAYLGIAEVRAEALPEQKLACVLGEMKLGFRPMVVGDGINDSLALRAGAVGVGMGAGGAEVALASADIVLLSTDLRRLGTCIRLSRRCRRTIHTNVAIGLGWTVAIVGAAASGLLGPGGALLAAVLHNLGTLAVMANAGRLLRFQEM
jgi:heavy metal translocating P-type ATPase